MKITIAHDKEDAADKSADKKEYSDYELKDGVDTLMKAEKIKQDPEMMEALHPHLDKHAKAAKKISSLKQLRAVAKEKTKGSTDDTY